MQKDEFILLLKKKIDVILNKQNAFITERDILAATVIELEDELACLKKQIKCTANINNDQFMYNSMLCEVIHQIISKQCTKIPTNIQVTS